MKTNQIKQALVVCSIILYTLFNGTLQAQNEFDKSIRTKRFYIQPNSGISQYYGDLNQKKYWNQNPQFAFGSVFGYQLNVLFGLQAQFLKTQLYSERPDQNLVFRSNLWDGALNITVNINELLAKIFTDTHAKSALNFYFFSGAGISSFRSKLTRLETGELVNEHSGMQYEFSLPLGAGAAYRLNNELAIHLEYGDHSIFGGSKLDFTDNSKQNNDHYSYISAGLRIKIGAKDTDNDGVKDKNDLCPGLFGKAELAGCPDNDNDGIADKDDACPDIAGIPQFMGCPDTDGDGITDKKDNCPNAAGKEELAGCPDRDNDGVADKDDKCPELPGRKALAGCPDRDDDGVTDAKDKCPDVPGRIDSDGCPDRDGDGIMDQDDKCPDEPGKPELAGCPDSDGDGIINSQDSCKYIAGKKELAGCPDRDGDGIADNADECPDIKGLIKFKGCPDTDGDGIPDNKDNCPGVAGPASNKGCPLVVQKAVTILLKTVYFSSGSSEMLPTFGNTLSLDAIVKSIKGNPDALISVSGYEDLSETGKSGEKLSEKRVDYVITYLEKNGIKSSKVKKYFFGKSKPASDNRTSEGRTLNRRVEIRILK